VRYNVSALGSKQMLQLLEDFYLAILRFVVLLVAGLILVGVVMLAIRSVPVFKPAPAPVPENPQVSADVLRRAILIRKPANDSEAMPPVAAADPLSVHYRNTATSIRNFFETNFPGKFDIDIEKVTDLVKTHAEASAPSGFEEDYAASLSESAAGILSDPNVIAYAKENDAMVVIDRLLSSFAEEFARQVRLTSEQNEARQAAYTAEKVRAQENLYQALAGFGTFLLIVFLSIIIRIERNLRPRDNYVRDIRKQDYT
jgi:hypothetical protein